MIVAGVGFNSQCEPQELVGLVRRAEAMMDLRVTSLAAPAWKLESSCLKSAAALLALPVMAIPEADLAAAAARCVTTSAAAQARAGVGSVAEAAALAAAGSSARLALPRIASRHATCALSDSQGDPP